MLKVIVDARGFGHFVVDSPGASEALVVKVAKAIAKDHTVHVLAQGVPESQDGRVFWWPPNQGPRDCDILVVFNHLQVLDEFTFDRCFSMLTGLPIGPVGYERQIEKFVCFSEHHIKLFKQQFPDISDEQAVVISPGVEVPQRTVAKIPRRLTWVSSADRGLWHLAMMWPAIIKEVPDATIKVTYGPRRWIEMVRWQHSCLASQALDVEDWLNSAPNQVIDAGVMPKLELAIAQQETDLFAFPYDPIGTDAVTALAGMEMAAYGSAMLMSANGGLPTVFDGGAEFLPMPVNYDQWLGAIVRVLKDDEERQEMSARAIQWARRHP